MYCPEGNVPFFNIIRVNGVFAGLGRGGDSYGTLRIMLQMVHCSLTFIKRTQKLYKLINDTSEGTS